MKITTESKTANCGHAVRNMPEKDTGNGGKNLYGHVIIKILRLKE